MKLTLKITNSEAQAIIADYIRKEILVNTDYDIREKQIDLIELGNMDQIEIEINNIK